MVGRYRTGSVRTFQTSKIGEWCRPLEINGGDPLFPVGCLQLRNRRSTRAGSQAGKCVTQLRTRTIDAWLYLLTSRTKDTALTANAWLQTDAGKEGDALQARTVLPLAPRSPVRKPSRRGTSLLRITKL